MLAVLHSVESAVTHEIQEARRRGETAQRSLADRGAITHHPPSPNTHPHTHTRPRRCSVGPQLSNPAPSHGLPCSAAHRFSSPASSTASISAGAVAHHPWSPVSRLLLFYFGVPGCCEDTAQAERWRVER